MAELTRAVGAVEGCPEWVRDAVFYQIFPDRFARSSSFNAGGGFESWTAPPTYIGFKGGNLYGVIERLDYLQELGITALYFNPLFQSAANHRYHTHDYFQVDPLLGGNRAFRALLKECHRRSMRVILDGVFNHASRGFFQFNHILENGPDSPYVDWFAAEDYPLNAYARRRKPNYDAWNNMAALPKFNTDNPQVREFLMEAAEYWTREGIDGWRLDVPLEITTNGFWDEFRSRVRAINPEAYIVAEIWYGSDKWLKEELFDASMNYVLQRSCVGYFLSSQIARPFKLGPYKIHKMTGTDFRDSIISLQEKMETTSLDVQLNLLSSHDVPRFLTLAKGEQRLCELAVLFQMTFPGVPCVYYGDEIGMEGGRDPDCRRAFPEDTASWNHDLLKWFKTCITLRHDHKVFRRGALHHVYADKTVYAFARTLGKETVLVVFNRGKRKKQVRFRLSGVYRSNAQFKDLLSKRVFSAAGDTLELALPGRGALVLHTNV